MTTEDMDNAGTLFPSNPLFTHGVTTTGVVGLPVDFTPPPPAQTGPDRVTVLDDIMRRWVQSHLHGSPVSRDTEAFNHVTASLSALRDMIIKEA